MSETKHLVLKIHPADNVLVALTDLKKGSTILHQDQSYLLLEDIAAKHKFFITPLEKGATVIMYGITVGRIKEEAVQVGQLMSTENTVHQADPYAYRNFQYQWQAPDVGKYQNKTFNGYHRADGKVGTANYWLFIPTVFCENRNLDIIKASLHESLGYAVDNKYKSYTASLVQNIQAGKGIEIDEMPFNENGQSKRVFKNIDGIKFLNHNGGCGGTRQDASTLSKLLAAYADHANVAGITLLSLGCQHLQIDDFKKDVLERNPKFDKPLIVFEQQSTKSEEALIKDAIKETLQHLVEANKIERAPAPLSKLNIGVKCGGSDGFSGISANPAVGHAADLLVAIGGQVLLAEFPELCGAEQELIDRCVDEKTANKFIQLMESYNQMAHAVGSGFHMNPSPGNIKDGLITDAIKSAGACKKGGTAPIVDVLDYTEPAIKAGLHLVCTPGNDVEATTGKAASGATLILFTTGLGTPTGNPICPVIKVATNSTLANRMSDIIDINTGAIIEGTKSIEEMGEEILDYCIKAASGEIVPKAVQLQQDDFIPWKRGVSL
jgi:altronate hydrolase